MRGILLDLDNTLLNDRHATEQGFRELVSNHKSHDTVDDIADEFVRWKIILARHWERWEKGEISFQEQRRCRVREFLGEELDDTAADHAYGSYQRGYESAWRLLPGVADFLERTAGIPKAIITNGEREAQLKKVRATMLDSHVIGVVTPSDCGHWKPSTVIFKSALALLQVTASECLMIGDDLVRDIEPARKLGMRYFHLQYGGNIIEAIDGF